MFDWNLNAASRLSSPRAFILHFYSGSPPVSPQAKLSPDNESEQEWDLWAVGGDWSHHSTVTAEVTTLECEPAAKAGHPVGDHIQTSVRIQAVTHHAANILPPQLRWIRPKPWTQFHKKVSAFSVPEGTCTSHRGGANRTHTEREWRTARQYNNDYERRWIHGTILLVNRSRGCYRRG